MQFTWSFCLWWQFTVAPIDLEIRGDSRLFPARFQPREERRGVLLRLPLAGGRPGRI